MATVGPEGFGEAPLLAEACWCRCCNFSSCPSQVMDPTGLVPVALQVGQGLYDLGNRHVPRAKLQQSAERMDTTMGILSQDGHMMQANDFDKHLRHYTEAKDRRNDLEKLTVDTSGIFNKNIRDEARYLDTETERLLKNVKSSSEEAKIRYLGQISDRLHAAEVGDGYAANNLPNIDTVGYQHKYLPVKSFPALKKKEEEFYKIAGSIQESLKSRSDNASAGPSSVSNLGQCTGETSHPEPPRGRLTKVKRPTHYSHTDDVPASSEARNLHDLQYRSYQQGHRVADSGFRDSTSVGPPSIERQISNTSSKTVSLEEVQSRPPPVWTSGIDGMTEGMEAMAMRDHHPHPPVLNPPIFYHPAMHTPTVFQPPPPQFGSHIHEPYPGPRQSTYDDPRTQQRGKENTSSARPLLRENPTNNHASGSSPLNSTYDRHETQQYGEEDESPLHPLLRRNPGENAHQPAPGHATTREGSSRDSYQRDHNDERGSYRERPSGRYADSRYEESSRAHHASAHGHGRSSERERQEKDRYEADRNRHRRGRRTDDYSDSRRGESSRTHYGGDGRPIRDESQDRYGKSKHTSDRRERHEHRTDDHYNDEKPRYRDHDDYRDRERNRKHGGAKEERYHQPSGRERYESSSKPSYGH